MSLALERGSYNGSILTNHSRLLNSTLTGEFKKKI